MFNIDAFLEESKQAKEIPTYEVEAEENAVSKRLLDVVTLIVASPYFSGRRHRSQGILNMVDEFLENENEERRATERFTKSIGGSSCKFAWTYLSKNEMYKQDIDDQRNKVADTYNKRDKSLQWYATTYVPTSKQAYKLLADNREDCVKEGVLGTVRIDDEGRSPAGMHLCGMPITQAFLAVNKKLLTYYEKYFATPAVMAIFDDPAFDAYTADKKKRAVVNIRDVRSRLQQAIAVDEVTAEEMFDVKFIHFCGLNSVQHYGEEKVGFTPGAFVAVVETFCEVPFRIVYYSCIADSFEFSQLAMTQRDGQSDRVVTYGLQRLRNLLQPAANKWNARMSEEEKYSECATRIILVNKWHENSAMKKFEMESAVKGLTPTVLPIVRQCVLLLQEQMWASTILCYPFKYKGEPIKYVLAAGSAKSFPQMNIARESYRKVLKPRLVKDFKIMAPGEVAPRDMAFQALEDLLGSN